MSQRLAFFLASTLGAVLFLLPSPAPSQAACDPTTSFCGNSSSSTSQQTYGQSGGINTGNANQSSAFGAGGGFGGGRTYGGGSTISNDLQQVPTYSDNLQGSAARQGNGFGQYLPTYFQRYLIPDQPTEFQRQVYASLGQTLPIYGIKLFLQSPSTFAPVDQIPVTSNYIVGPGDQLLIRVWGQINFNAEVTVDRNGAVYLPQIGAIHVGGYSYDALQQHVRSDIAHIYKNFDLSVNLGELHPIRIFVTGQARFPGTYTVSSLSTLVSAVFATSGPSPTGSLRHIQLRRNGTTVADFDMYDLLVHGDKSHDVPLLPGDVIYIPPVGPQVAVYGSVRNAAIYELKGGDASTSVGDLLDDAGGLSNIASRARASLERIDSDQHQRALDISLNAAGRGTPLQDGDILRVLSISPRFDQTVTLRGNLADPGRFAWHPGMHLSELLPDSAALVTRDYWQRRNQLGLPSPVFQPDYTQRFTAYRKAQAESQRKYLLELRRAQQKKNYDAQQQTLASQPTDQTQLAADGSTDDPGPPPDADTGSTTYDPNAPPNAVSDFSVPGPTDSTSQSAQATTARSNVIGGGSLADQQQSSRTENTSSARSLINIKLPAPEIDWSYAVIERMDPVTLQTTLIPFDLGKLVMQHDASQDLAVEPHDIITIFSQADIRVPQSQQTKLVRIEGEVAHAGIYSAEPGETLRHIVERAGGVTPNAYVFGAALTRESARLVQQQRLDDYVTQLELEIDRASASSAAGAITAQDTAASAASLASSQALVARLRDLRASGRVVLAIAPDADSAEALPQIVLEDGDRIIVPSRPTSVNVVGAVYEQSSFLFENDRRVYGYLKEAGGANRDADKKHAFVVRADGSVLSRESASTFWGNEFDQSRIHPGDTIVMPEKVYRGSSLRSVLDFSQLFSSLALGVGGLAVITN